MGFLDRLKKSVSDVISDIKNEISENADGGLDSLVGSLGKSLGDLGKGKDLGLGKSAQSMLGSLASSLTKPSGHQATRPARQPDSQPARHSPSGDAAPIALNSNLALILIRSYLKEAEIDADGDIIVRFKLGDSVKFSQLMYVYVHPDELVYDMVISFKEVLGDMESGRDKIARDHSGIRLKIDGAKVRFKYTQSMEGKTTDDVELIIHESHEIYGRLKKSVYDFMMAYSGAEKPRQAFRFTTDLVEKWLKIGKVTDYSVDSEGDIKAEYGHIGSFRFGWFVWYYISDEVLTVDAGMSRTPSWVDIDVMLNQINNNVGCEFVKAVVNKNGHLRFKAAISGGACADVEKISETWLEIHRELKGIITTIADFDDRYESQKAEREAASRRQASRIAPEERSASRSPSSSRSASTSAAKTAEQERKRKEKEEKDRKKKSIDDSIKRQQLLIDSNRRNIEQWSKNIRNPNDSSAMAVKNAREAIKRSQAEIARLREKKARL